MRKFYYTAVICCLLSVSAAAQNRARVFDNFDTTNGVKVTSPTIPPISVSKPKQLVKKTAQTKPSAQNTPVLKINGKDVNYSKFLMAGGSSLKGFTTGDLVIDSYILDSSKRYNIDPLLIYAHMHK